MTDFRTRERSQTRYRKNSHFIKNYRNYESVYLEWTEENVKIFNKINRAILFYSTIFLISYNEIF